MFEVGGISFQKPFEFLYTPEANEIDTRSDDYTTISLFKP